MKIDVNEFWSRIDEFMKASNKTRKQFSSDCGFQERRIESLLNGKRLPTPDECVDIARVMKVSVDYLLTGKAAETKNLSADDATALEYFQRTPKMLKPAALRMLKGFGTADEPMELEP